MSQVFISYKREDQTRVARLANALEKASLDVWWDGGLPGGESWRTNIEAALESAGCVVSVWSRASVAKDGHFVRDEASRGLARGVLVPILIDRVDPPLGFREIQAIDLVHWNGNSRDPFFGDLVAAIRAKIEGRPVPKAAGPTARLRKRLTFAGSSTAAIAIGASLFFNALGTSSKVCTMAAMQPALSDTCGNLGLGGRPSRAERVEWAARKPGSCDDLRTYVDRYHNRGAYLDEANAMLAARRILRRQREVPGTRFLALTAGRDGAALASRDLAQNAAINRAQPEAQRLCEGFEASAQFKLVSANAKPQRWNCANQGRGIVCGFDGQAVCNLREGEIVESETCGGIQ